MSAKIPASVAVVSGRSSHILCRLSIEHGKIILHPAQKAVGPVFRKSHHQRRVCGRLYSGARIENQSILRPCTIEKKIFLSFSDLHTARVLKSSGRSIARLVAHTKVHDHHPGKYRELRGRVDQLFDPVRPCALIHMCTEPAHHAHPCEPCNKEEHCRHESKAAPQAGHRTVRESPAAGHGPDRAQYHRQQHQRKTAYHQHAEHPRKGGNIALCQNDDQLPYDFGHAAYKAAQCTRQKKPVHAHAVDQDAAYQKQKDRHYVKQRQSKRILSVFFFQVSCTSAH